MYLDNWKVIDKIVYHLWPSYGGFLYILHEDNNFNIEKFNELIFLVKELKIRKINPISIWNYFVFILIDKITYLYDVLRDLYVHKNKLNITEEQYYLNILELKYEILSLFDNNITEDFHWNKY